VLHYEWGVQPQVSGVQHGADHSTSEVGNAAGHT
jgi:hypothetical protein